MLAYFCSALRPSARLVRKTHTDFPTFFRFYPFQNYCCVSFSGRLSCHRVFRIFMLLCGHTLGRSSCLHSGCILVSKVQQDQNYIFSILYVPLSWRSFCTRVFACHVPPRSRVSRSSSRTGSYVSHTPTLASVGLLRVCSSARTRGKPAASPGLRAVACAGCVCDVVRRWGGVGVACNVLSTHTHTHTKYSWKRKE